MTPAERALWLAARRHGVGSSDAPALCNQSIYDTAFGIWMDKLGMRPDRPPNKQMRAGILLEATIGMMYALERGVEVVPYPHTTHPKHDWMMATPDRLVVGERKLCEIKKVNFFARMRWGKSGTDEIPADVCIQVMHQLEVTGYDLVDVAALIGDDLRIYPIERNQRLIDRLLEIEFDFWDKHVMPQEPPGLDWRHASTTDVLKHLYRSVNDVEIDLPADLEAHARAYQACTRAEKMIKEKKRKAQNLLLSEMGNAGIARLPDGTALIRQQINRTSYEVKPASFITFRVKPPKGVTNGNHSDREHESEAADA